MRNVGTYLQNYKALYPSDSEFFKSYSIPSSLAVIVTLEFAQNVFRTPAYRHNLKYAKDLLISNNSNLSITFVLSPLSSVNTHCT
jgi:meiotically up-regulated gene 157 (Mug157) protein